MTLPELLLQNAYGRLAWAIVIAAMVAGLLPASWKLSRRASVQMLGILVALMLLPGPWSPSYWIALAFQWPSGLLTGLCLARLTRPWRAPASSDGLPFALAGALALLGVILYTDALGLTSLGLYFWGFSPRAAPLFALACMALCIAGIIQGSARAHYFAGLGALALFTLLRLPTGNLWDALLDPMLWIWAVLSLAARARRKWERNTATTKINEGVVRVKS